MTNPNDFSGIELFLREEVAKGEKKKHRDIHSQIHLSVKYQGRLHLELLINAGSVSCKFNLIPTRLTRRKKLLSVISNSDQFRWVCLLSFRRLAPVNLNTVFSSFSLFGNISISFDLQRTHPFYFEL